MKKLFNWKFLLLFIVLIGGFLRFYNINSNPPSLNWDEAAWGYNAYSLGINGRDEFGRFLPHDYLESYGDFKPPVYAYLDVVPVKVFGLNEFAVRFPSAFLGTLAILLTFFLVEQIFYNSKKKKLIALSAAFFLSISPWHIMLSRGAFEANVANFFIILGVWAFLKAVRERKEYLYLSAVIFALTFYIFNTPRVVSPILVLLLAVIFRKSLWKIKKTVAFSAVLGFLVFLPTFGFLLTPQAGLRFKEVNIFSDVSVVRSANQEIANDNNSIISKALHNRRFLYAVDYVKHYFDNLNPNFLFIKGDPNTKFSTQNTGQMYIWDIGFFVLGILLVFRKREGYWWLVPLWLLVGIIPAATARETPHALRIESSLPMFQILVAYGFVYFYEWLKNKKFYKPAIILVVFLLLGNFIYFYHDLLYNYSYRYSQDWQFGYKEAFVYVKTIDKNYDSVRVTNALGRPYIYYLVYQKINPKYYRNNAIVTRDSFGFVSVEKVGKYYFPKVLEPVPSDKNALYIGIPGEVPESAKIIKKFYDLNGNLSLMAYTL